MQDTSGTHCQTHRRQRWKTPAVCIFWRRRFLPVSIQDPAPRLPPASSGEVLGCVRHLPGTPLLWLDPRSDRTRQTQILTLWVREGCLRAKASTSEDLPASTWGPNSELRRPRTRPALEEAACQHPPDRSVSEIGADAHADPGSSQAMNELRVGDLRGRRTRRPWTMSCVYGGSLERLRSAPGEGHPDEGHSSLQSTHVGGRV